MYLLALPVNFIRLVQIRNLVARARSSAQGTLSLDWLRPFMTPRSYQKGDVLFRKGDVADEMFLTVSGRFLVSEIGVELPADRILGELGFLSPDNIRTQTVECIESGEVLAITYEKLLEIYMDNPEFGYYFLRLTSDRLLQNHARVQSLVDQAQAELAAAKAALARGEADDALGTGFRRFASFARLATRRLSGEDFEIESLFGKPDAEATHRRLLATAVVSRYSNYAVAGGFIPVPYVNEATMMAVNMRMVKALYELYDKPFEINRAHSLVAGLMAGAIPARLATVAGFVPGVHVLGLAVASLTAAVLSRRLGHKLIEHFEREAAIERDRIALEEFRRANVWFRRWTRNSRAVLVYGIDLVRRRRGEALPT
jgi:CRP-like cAMP-binding protein